MDAFKLTVCIMPIVLFRLSLPNSLSLTIVIVFIVFLTRPYRYFPSDVLCITFHLSAEVISRDFYFTLCGRPFTFSEKSAADVRNAYGVMMQIIAVGNKGREIA